MEFTFAIVGTISGIISIAGLLYFAGVWRGRVDRDLDYFRKCHEQYPPAEISNMVKTLWDIYVIGALRSRPDLADHHSAFKLRPEGKDLIPDEIKKELRDVPRNPLNKDEIASGYLVVKFLGLERVSKMAEQKGLSVQEAVAVLSTYLDDIRHER